MDGESSYESDVSESWSLVDINSNEEPITASEAYLFLHPADDPPLDSEVHVGRDRNENFTSCSNLNNCESKSQFTIIGSYPSDLGNNDFESDNRKEFEERSKTDSSCDAESIEILNLEGNTDSDFDKLDVSNIGYEAAYPSDDDDELFYEENTNNKLLKNCASVKKRKRRKLSQDSDSSKDSINSYCNSSEIYVNEHASKTKIFSNDTNSQPVYKHYRNNVANAVLSLSVGVIFAGVACLAIGHFLETKNTLLVGMKNAVCGFFLFDATYLLSSWLVPQITFLKIFSSIPVVPETVSSFYDQVGDSSNLHSLVKRVPPRSLFEAIPRQAKSLHATIRDCYFTPIIPNLFYLCQMEVAQIDTLLCVQGSSLLLRSLIIMLGGSLIVSTAETTVNFTGVQDAGEMSVEVLESLKKLQKENIALQSRLSNLNKALSSGDIDSKIEVPSSIISDKNFNDIKPTIELEKNHKVHLLTKTSNSIDWLSKLQELVKRKDKCSNVEKSIAFDHLMTYIHEGLSFLSKRKESDARLKDLEEADAKISKTLQKIIDKLSSSQDNIEMLYDKLFKLKNKINKKLNKIFPNFLRREKERKNLKRAGADFNAIQRRQKRKETDITDKIVEGSVSVYKFPQPKEYYDVKESIRMDDKNQSRSFRNYELEKNTSEVLFEPHEEKEKEIKDEVKEKKDDEDGETKDENKRNVSRDVKKEKKKEKKRKEDKEKESKRKRIKERSVNTKTFEKGKKVFVKNKIRERKNLKVEKDRSKFPKKNSGKNAEKSEFHRALPSKFNRSKRNKNGEIFSAKRKEFKSERDFNATGYWVFKWADGREKFRYQKVADWQFERAKGRKELRNGEYVLNWQFKRASGRERDRNDDRWYSDKYKLRNYNGKGLFQEEFSWI